MSRARSGVRSVGGQVEQVLEHLVDDGAAHGVEGERLGEPVDGAEAVEQRAGHEVAGPAGGERAQDVDPVDAGCRSARPGTTRGPTGATSYTLTGVDPLRRSPTARPDAGERADSLG